MNFTQEKIYVFAPAGYASGGPEALHQLAHSLKKLGKNVKMFYYDLKLVDNLVQHSNYSHYELEYETDINKIENNNEVLLIIPETYCQILNNMKLKYTSKAIWWLSVDFFFINEKSINKYFGLKRFIKGDLRFPSLNDIKEMSEVVNIPNSYYTLKFLQDNNLKHTKVVSDYLNKKYLEEPENKLKKEDIIIYNPAKNGQFLNKIIERTQNLNWIPIKGMTQEEVKALMNKAKIYIDFGFHPGRERMPREACLAKCCLIIGKDGAARYKEDMPIDDYYHFETKDKNIEKIISVIDDCFKNYNEKFKDFSNYKDNILNAEHRFNAEVKNVFSE